MDIRNYSVTETTRSELSCEIRALRPEDRHALTTLVGRASNRSLYRRFFVTRRKFTEKQIDFFVDVDFSKHVALVSLVDEGGHPTIVGGGRYVLVEPGQAELAFFIIDDYQGQGIGALLMRHLTNIAKQRGVGEFVAEVLSENRPMLQLFEKSGLPMNKRHEADVVHVTLRVGV
jgi:RimJ/RimL family protein N-acetyltransferase